MSVSPAISKTMGPKHTGIMTLNLQCHVISMIM